MPAAPKVRGGDAPYVTPEMVAAAQTSMIETMGMAEHHVGADT